MRLVIVESPAKARTIKRYLGPDFTVMSSYGHVRDLPEKKMGVDTRDFTPTYEVLPRARRVVQALRKVARKAREIYFATDEDREGEAIAWHLTQLLEPSPRKVKRITFDEITKRAIRRALKHPRGIDERLVNAQQARRILDRLVGYELSPFLWRKVRRGLSAGRVQSVALRLIVDRERERERFRPQEYWTIEADLLAPRGKFTAALYARNGKILPKLAIRSKQEAHTIVQQLKTAAWEVARVNERTVRQAPSPPFTTSTLQQAAANILGFTAKKTMQLAQQLYEGVELGKRGPTALITYMRTDSVHLAPEAVAQLRRFIEEKFGTRYLPPQPPRYKTKTRAAQEAHEAIRPTHVLLTPERVRAYLSRDLARLYELIWRRTVACQMPPAQFQAVTVDISAKPRLNGVQYTFRATGSRLAFDGHLRVATRERKEKMLPPLTAKTKLKLEQLRPLQHMTQPPPRYSEAALVRALEEHGIGRPSTYAPIIDTIQRRGYVQKGPDRRFYPTDVGKIVTELLARHFSDIVDIDFTAKMENQLDDIARGKIEWKPMLATFYQPFHAKVKQKLQEVQKKEILTEKTDEKCPRCGAELQVKLGRFGKFVGCSNFPRCKFTRPADYILNESEKEVMQNTRLCPECQRGRLEVKQGRYGLFLSCSHYPDCRYIERLERKTGTCCPTCKRGEIIERRSKRGKIFYGCNRYPQCKFALWQKPTGENCGVCGSLLAEFTGGKIMCINRSCSSRTGTSKRLKSTRA